MKKQDDSQFIKTREKLNRKNKENEFFDIPGTSFFPVGDSGLARIDDFDQPDPFPVLVYDYSPLKNGSATTTFEVPPYYRKGKTFSIELLVLTNRNQGNPIKGRA